MVSAFLFRTIQNRRTLSYALYFTIDDASMQRFFRVNKNVLRQGSKCDILIHVTRT